MNNIPITKPYFSEEEESAIIFALRSGWVSQGPKVIEFEEAFSRYVGSTFAVATTSCTTALFLALKVAGIKRGDEVVCPSLSFIATANSILHADAVPKFVDIDSYTYNIDVSLIEKAITKNTRAIMPVHQGGLACDIDGINKIARKYGLSVIEDAACAIGSGYKGKKIGSGTNLACFSFHPRKILVIGEGGMITTNNPRYAQRLKRLRHHGMSVSDLERHKSKKVIIEEYAELGYNFRMTDLQASIGIIQLGKLAKMLTIRRMLAERYNRLLTDIEGIRIPYVPVYAYPHNYAYYMIRLEGNSAKFRNNIMEELLKEGVSTRRGIMSIHREPFYRKAFGRLKLPETERVSDSTIILPLYPAMTELEQDHVIKQLRRALNKFRRK
jgi:dTDP-4-amino-4,6-dideoxygalactose transaminase